jgi:NAD(P)-dependent dehydrogenase (short-subunit alcohol dehydrogenase family)
VSGVNRLQQCAPRHGLIVGGSGMLAGLCQLLAADGWELSIVGRDETKLARATAPPRLHPVAVDYQDLAAFNAALAGAAAARGPFVLAVCWIRSWAPDSLRAAAAAVAPGARLVHVIGSQRSDESAAAIAELERREDLVYQQVQLGAVIDNCGQRWLTNDEISNGIYAALHAEQPYYLVGTLVP